MKAAALLRFHLRRERWLLPIWLLGILGLLAASGFAVAREFGGEEERYALAAVAASNPAFLFLRGLPDGSSVGALVFFQTFSFLAVLTALMNTFLVVRHTRADEERGRSELLAATATTRTADLRATLALALIANIILAVGSTAIGMTLAFPLAAACLIGLALGSVGLAFAGIAALVSQLMPSPRGANGVSAALVGIAYLTRGIGDALGTATDPTHVSPAWISALSPIGWAQATAPFSRATGAPLLALLGLAALAAAVALVVRANRDLGASLIAERRGRPAWPTATAGRLAARLQRGTLIGWAVGGAVLGLFAGALSPLAAEAVESNADLAELISRLAPGLETDTESLFAVALLGIAGTMATAAGVQAMIRMRVDESEGRAELLLTTELTRAGWIGRQGLVAAGSMLIIAVTTGLVAGVSFLATGSDLERIGVSVAAVAVHLPAGLVFVAATALVFAAVPRATAALGWGLLVLGLVVGQLGELVGLPDWIQVASPLSHVPAVPLETVNPAELLINAAIALVLFGIAVALLRRRDVRA